MADFRTPAAVEPIPFRIGADTFEMPGADEGRPHPLLINSAASDGDILAVARARLERFTFDLGMLACTPQPVVVPDLAGFAFSLKARVEEVLSLVAFVNQRLYKAERGSDE